jgi:hypothetical protein
LGYVFAGRTTDNDFEDSMTYLKGLGIPPAVDTAESFSNWYELVGSSPPEYITPT